MSTERYIEVFIGPQHPGSGHMRFIVSLDGDIILDFEPDIGYVHRAVEKIAETKTYIQIIPLVERPIVIDAINVNLAYVLALERLLDVEVPRRARYLRTLMAELNRIASHLYGMGIHGIMVGSSTMFMWCFADREVLIELMQMITGARVTYSYVVPGGVRRDLPQGFEEKVLKAFKYLENRLPDYHRIFIENPVTVNRLEDVGVITKNRAIELGITGPNLRGSGVAYDARKAEPYGAYPEIDFEIALREEGDSYARLLVRVEEIRRSMEIVKQVLKKMPENPILHERYLKLILPKWKAYFEETGSIRFPGVYATLRPPAGEAIARVEGGRGEVVCYVVSDGSPRPYRLRLITPSFRNVIAFREALVGNRVADIPAVYGSLDYFPPEADR